MKYLAIITVLFCSGIVYAKTNSNEYKLIVTENGFEPASLKVKAGSPIVLKITRKTNSTCARDLTIPTEKIKVELPLDKEVVVKIASLKKGEIKFGCAMEMMVGGVLLAE
jgi:plastocyanin domain-containing protein